MKINAANTGTTKGPAETFTGDVYVDAIATPASGLSAALVHFTPGARTNWHTHPHGQTLFVVDGLGLVQAKDGPIREIRAGDCVYFEPGEVHWHGASANRFMAHIAMLKLSNDGEAADWGDAVTDEEYAGR